MIYKNVNGTLKLVTNIRKPRKYRRFEYLESTGTLWIDSGINPKIKPRVVAKLATLNTTARSYWGNKDSGSSSYSVGFASNKLLYYRYGSATSATVNYTVSQQTVYEWDTSDKVYVNGVLKYTSPNTYTYRASQGNIQIFKAARNNSPGTFRLYSFKLYDGDSLVRDYVPAEFNGEYGLWDLVQNRFYGNKGTGTFTVGPEVGKPYDEIEKLIIPNTLLPYGIELYDYIESTGTQWIDTGVYGYMNHSYELDFLQTAVGNYRTWGVFGLSSYIGYNMSFTYGSGWIIRWSSTSSGQSYVLMNTIDTNRHTLKILNGVVYFDGTNKGTSTGHNTSYSINYNLYLFTINPANTTPTTNNKVKIFSYKDIDVNGVLVRNMLPCTYFGEPGMWDTVTKLFYRNLGTGEFILGNKIVLLDHEYLENTTNAYINLQYIPTNNTGIKIETSPSRVASTQVVLGRGASSNTSRWWINFTSNNNISLGWNSTYSPGTYEANSWYKIEYNYLNSRGCVVNDVSNTYNYPTLKLTSDPIGLFANYTSPSSTVFRGKVKYVQITEEDKIVRDFVPCSYNGTPGMWDKIECKFYESANSNTFTLGRKLSGEIPIWVLKNALIKSSSNGTYDYIDTGINNYTMNNIRCVCEMEPLNGEDTAFFGSRGSYYLFYNVSGNYFWPTSKCETILGRLAVGCKYLVDWNKGTLTVTGENEVYEQGIRSSTTNNTQNLYIFTHNPKDSRTAEAKIYWFKIYIDDVLVRDFVPATMGGKPGLYDKVNHKMYFNANSSGNFTVE